MIAQKATEKEWNTALREISTAELREATLALGLKLAPVDLSWETFCAQFHSALERFQEANIDITTFVLMKDMLEQTKKEVHSLRHFAYLGLTQIILRFKSVKRRVSNDARTFIQKNLKRID